MAASASTSVILIFPCFLLFQPFLSLSITAAGTTTTTTTAAAIATTTPTTKIDQPFILPLRTQKLASSSLPTPPNKLLFHHNVSLTVSLSVGSPPQNVSLVLDTGSELSWLLCDSKTSPSFRPRASSSYSSIPCSSPTCRSQTRDLPIPATCDASRLCHVALSYADASSSEGTLAADLFSLGASPPLRTAFGCMTAAYSSAAGDPAAVGMLGMNRGSLSFVSQTNTRRFSYCISDRDSSGVLLLGHAALSFLPLNYTPLVKIC